MKKSFFKILFFCGIPGILRKFKGNSVTVLSLHRISNEKDFFFQPILPETFDKLVAYCKKHYEIIGFKDIFKESDKPKLILSFDDGYYDFMENALPVLQKYQVPSNHNLVNACLNANHVIWTQKLNDIFNFLKENSIFEDSDINDLGVYFKNSWTSYYLTFFQKLLKYEIDERNKIIDRLTVKYKINLQHKMMSWVDALNCAEKYNVEIGCHTYTHESLFSINSEDVFKSEIAGSINEMNEKIGKKVEILALPNGQYNDDVINYIRGQGIKYILFVDNKINHINPGLDIISRVNLVNENYFEMVHRVELFQSKLRKFI